MRPWWTDYFDEDFLRIYRDLLPQDAATVAARAIVEAAELSAGAHVLDLACGWGRHAHALAEHGVRVVGADRSDVLLRTARADSATGNGPVWVRADMRELPFLPRFDAVLSLFSSLGYFLEDEEDLRVLREVRAALLPGGRFVLETMHRDAVVRDYAERDWWWGEEGERVWVEREFDPIRGITREVLHRLGPDGNVAEKRHEARIRTATEWNDLLRAAGLQPLHWYGGWELEPFEHGSDSLIVIARSAV